MSLANPDTRGWACLRLEGTPSPRTTDHKRCRGRGWAQVPEAGRRGSWGKCAPCQGAPVSRPPGAGGSLGLVCLGRTQMLGLAGGVKRCGEPPQHVKRNAARGMVTRPGQAPSCWVGPDGILNPGHRIRPVCSLLASINASRRACLLSRPAPMETGGGGGGGIGSG